MNSAVPTRVCYEISTLGFSHGSAAEMGGVYRVIVRMLEQARKTPEIAAGFVAQEHPLAEVRARAALDELWPGAGNEVVSTWRVPLPLGVHRWLDARSRRSGARLAKLARKGAHALARRAQPAGEGDIFHSFTYGLPAEKFTSARARFLTIWDMIPIKFPHYYGARGEFMQAHFTGVAASARGPRDWVLCSSESAKRDYCEFTGVSSERVFVTPWAAGAEFHPESDPQRIVKVRAQYALPAGPFLLSLCTLEPRKNLPHLIRAFAAMLAAEPRRDVHLVLAGAKGWEFEEIFRSIEGAGAARERIHTPGRIADADLAALYSAAAGFVYPSLYEGFGLPPLEAMQCGTPVISSNASAMPEVVGDAGLLVDPNDLDALVQAMRLLLDSPELRADLRERGLQRARQFSWERTIDLTLAAYRTALTHA